MVSSNKPSATKLTHPINIDGREYLHEPPFAEEKAKIWRSKVLIPLSLADETLAFLGPLPENRHLEITRTDSSLFPSSHISEPVISAQQPFSLRYVDRNFRTAPPKNCPKFCAWMDRLESEQIDHWKRTGIYTLLQIARCGPPQYCGMLLVSLQFWESSTNSFHSKCGMITPTLLDIAAITGLKLTGEVFDCEAVAPIPLRFEVGDYRKPTYKKFIDHHATSAGPVTDEEHVAFLTLWLSRFVFCSRSMQVAKHFALLATQLHQERDIALGQLFLASLYESLSEVVFQIRHFDLENSRKKNVLVHGPFCFLQLWLNATFSKDIAPYGMRRVACPQEERHLIWNRLIPLTPIDKNFPDLQVFRLLFNIMLTRVDFLPSMAPFSRRTEGPAWLTRPFPPTDGEHRDETFLIWRRLLVPRFLSVETSSNNPCLVAYQPNLVARKFGLCQFIPKSLFSSQELLANILYGQPWSEIEEEIETIWKNRPRLPSLPFRPAYYCTKEFHDWWQTYFTIYVSAPEAKLSELTEAFLPLNPAGPAPANQPTPSTQEAQPSSPFLQAVSEKSSDDDERPIAQGQPRSTDPTVSSHSKKSKKHKRSSPTGSKHSSQHKSKSHHGHKRKKHDSPSRSGETKKKRHHTMPTPEVPAEDVDTIVVDTSILDKVPDPAMGASQSNGTSPTAALGKENQDAVSPASTQADASAEPTQPVADYTPSSPVSSLARPFQSVDTAGEFIEFPIQIRDSDSDSVTSPATHPDSSSNSSDSSLSSASLPLQDPRGPVGVDTNKQQPSQTTPLSTASPSSQTTPPSAASRLSFSGLAIKPSALEAIARLRNLVKSRDASSDSEQLHSGKMGPEATKIEALMDKICVHALNPDLRFVLMDEPAVGPEILCVLSQLKDLQL
ncbi:uncharacterized protein LOC127104031 [Lathyrus oleraceus]|uniref:uncharacterized protein LOC127104031 n=1 Tax=Pisum sativum TaxID=3888 RepID=UPI0021D303E8|nr:uncharacterized protein LOC127104031 [Pisum sativum]